MEFSFQENAGNWQITNPIGLIARDRLITTSDEMQISREHRTTSVRFGSLRADNPVVVDGVLAHLSLVDL